MNIVGTLLLNFWWLLVLIGVMILVHELGHFWAARLFDVRVDVFSIGFGPRLFGFKRGDTDYRFSAILFGGYVKMAGDQPGDASVDDPRGLLHKPRWQRLIVAAAGPFMNVVLAVAVLTGLYMVSYEKIIDDGGAVVGHVMPGSSAARAGIREGDKIVRLNGQNNPDWEDILTREIESVDRPLTVTVERKGHLFSTTVTPVVDQKEGIGSGWEGQNEIQVGDVRPGMPAASAGLKKGDLLVKVNDIPIHSRFTLPEVIRKSEGKPVTIEYQRSGILHTVTMKPVYGNVDGTPRWMIGVASDVKWHIQKSRLSFPDALRQSVATNTRYATLIVDMLRGIIERRMPANNLEGPIGIAHEATQAAQEGPMAFLTLMSIVSLNLAIFNLLPIPILDGAMILTLLIEMVMGRDLSLNVKEAMLRVGFVFLMMIVVFVLYNDIARRITPGTLVGYQMASLHSPAGIDR
jgi:regulator of sigma E protease